MARVDLASKVRLSVFLEKKKKDSTLDYSQAMAMEKGQGI